MGCNFSLYKGDYYRVNGYDERVIGRGLEDNNLCNRLKNAGIKIRYISNEAVQYHQFHSFDPVPHTKEVIKSFGNPTYSWTPYGIVKTEDGPE